MKKALTLLTAAVMALGISLAPRTASADQSTEELLKRIEQLEKKVAELEGKGGGAAGAAVAPVKASKGEIWGQAWINYDYISSGTTKSNNTFKLDRAYLGYNGTLSADSKYVFLLDADTTTSANTRLDLFVKNAYYQKDNILKDASLILGQHATPWTGNEEAAWKYRPIYKSFADDNGILKTADFGASLKGKFTYGDYHVMLANGEGFGNVDSAVTDHKKELQGRVSFTPAKNWPRISLLAKLGGRDATWDNTYGILLNQQIDAFSYGVSGLANFTKSTTGVKTNKTGFSLYGNYDIPESAWSAFARYDNFDPSRITSGNNKTAVIVGAAYKLDKTTRIILADVNNKDKGAGTKTNTLRATVEIGF